MYLKLVLVSPFEGMFFNITNGIFKCCSKNSVLVLGLVQKADNKLVCKAVVLFIDRRFAELRPELVLMFLVCSVNIYLCFFV